MGVDIDASDLMDVKAVAADEKEDTEIEVLLAQLAH